ncbi:response regulator [Brevibacillus sp. NPDC003359]|uniref:response regulator n=1 Tax=unclassified Brevibacillus TaxID=2684853 RepID=UPI0036C65A56
MIKVMIVEDEKPILDLMKHVIGQNDNYTIVGAFTHPLEALACLPDLCPDVAFLDVEMPKMNGLELGAKMNELSEHTKIVFTTAYKKYALDAFKVYAFDYILKPVTPAAIERVTDRLVKQLQITPPINQSEKSVSIQCFGGLDVRNSAGEVVRWPTRKSEELFAYFLCHPKQDINKWHLTDLLWPEMDEDRATHNLHNTMYRLKKIMKEQELGIDIQKTNDGYMFHPTDQNYDVWAFQQYDFSFSQKLQSTIAAEALCAMYKGPLLDRKDYLWKAPLEEAYRKKYTSLVSKLVELDLASQEWQKGLRKLEDYLSIYPLHEEMNIALMDIYARCDQKQNIIRHYAKFEKAYRLELEMDPPRQIRNWVASVVGE